MTVFLFANNAHTTLAGPIAAGATSLSLAAGTGALFPAPAVGQQFELTLTSQTSQTVREIAYCTARSGDVCTIVRGQEGTTPLSFVAGDFADNFLTAGTTAAFTQASQLQQQTGNYAVDTGTVNALNITLNPAAASLPLLIGVPLRVLVANSNTASSTITVNGLANTLITNPDGTILIPGQLSANGPSLLIYDGTTFNLMSAASYHPGFSNEIAFFSNSGWIAPVGVWRVKFRVWGAGGGGGAGTTSTGAGSGGGAGGYAEGMAQVVPGQTYTVSVGAAGVGSSSNANGGGGGNSQFAGFAQATGGGGGFTSAGGGQGSVGSGGNGTGGSLTLPGQTGGSGFTVSGIPYSGSGGGAFCGPGAPGAFGPPGNGGTGITPAGGGSGGAGGIGGNGGGGLVILEF